MFSIALSRRFASIVRVVGLAVAVLLLFLLTTLVCAFILAGVRGTPIGEPLNWLGGIVCSLISWLFILSFHVRKETTYLRYSNREALAGKILSALTEQGYDVCRPTPDRLVGKPSFAALLLGGTVQVQFQGNSAAVCGPKISVEGLRHRLRFESHLDSNRRTLEDSGWNMERGQLRSVQIQFRIPVGQSAKVADEVIASLTQIGATVHCDIGIWAQNDQGMEEVVIEKLLRDRLQSKGIAAVVHRKPLVPANQTEPNAVGAVGAVSGVA